MKKEEIITIIIIIFIIGAEIITQKYTNNSLDELDAKLKNLKEMTLSKQYSNGELKQTMEEIGENWKKKDDILSYYLEHEELEKIYTQIKKIKAHFETDLEEEVVPEIEEGIYLLDHLKDKQKLNLKANNIK